MKAGLIAMLLMVAATSMAAAWTPPANPDADAILTEAVADARAGRLSDAAAKHRWYHHNVLRLVPAHSGVRLSFALSDWYRLAERYAPAMTDFRAERDQLLSRVRAGGSDAGPSFFELTRFNEHLREPELTRDAFLLLVERDPSVSARALHAALPDLVALRAYPVAVKHMDVAALTERLVADHQRLSDVSGLPPENRAGMARFLRKHTDLSWARVVVTLQQSGRAAEALKVAQRARQLLGSEVALPLIDAALRGEPPPRSIHG